MAENILYPRFAEQRLTEELKDSLYLLGDLPINYPGRRVTLAGRPVELTATEYALLFELSINSGLVLTHDRLRQRGRGEGNSGDSGLVRIIVKKLRRTLGDEANNPAYIFTEPRVGYRIRKGETQYQGEPKLSR